MTMTSRERFIAALQKRQPDRVPTAGLLYDHAAIVAGVKCSDMRNDPRVATKAFLAAYEMYKPDGLLSHHDRLWQYGDFGIELRCPDFDQPSIVGQFFKEPEDAFKLDMPDPHSKKGSPLWWRMVEHVESLVEAVGQRAVVMAMHHGVFSMGTMLRGASNFMLDLVEHPEAVHKIVEKTSSLLLERWKILIDKGVRFVRTPDPCSSCDLISPRHFKEFAQPYVKRINLEAKRYAREKYGEHFYSVHHICGETTLILEYMADLGAECISIDQKVDLAVAKRKVGDKVCIMGNVEPSNVLLLGTPELVDQVSKECIEKAGKGGGYILASGCMTPIYSPIENVKAMMDAAAKYGVYKN